MNKKKPDIRDFFEVYPASVSSHHKAFLFESQVRAGFPSPAEDVVDGYLDLNEFLVRHPSATFYVRVAGDSMVNAGIYEGDILLVDRALEPKNNDIVIAYLDGEFTLKRLIIKDDGRIFLVPENPNYEEIEITKDRDFMIWGVVAGVIRKLR